VRLEVYRDEDAYTTAVAQTLYEATVGVTITPFPNDPYGQFFKIRPELRYDYSTENFFDGFSKHYQVTAAVDAIFNF
jgi:Putative beta-barrel porin-2, OmpL-like. bbp2